MRWSGSHGSETMRSRGWTDGDRCSACEAFVQQPAKLLPAYVQRNDRDSIIVHSDQTRDEAGLDYEWLRLAARGGGEERLVFSRHD